jgi:hypothetical protein
MSRDDDQPLRLSATETVIDLLRDWRWSGEKGVYPCLTLIRPGLRV